jgi:hypothetical protein
MPLHTYHEFFPVCLGERVRKYQQIIPEFEPTSCTGLVLLTITRIRRSPSTSACLRGNCNVPVVSADASPPSREAYCRPILKPTLDRSSERT